MSDVYEYAVIYTDGGMQTHDEVSAAGWGVHGYFFDSLPSVRFSKVPSLITPEGYKDKATGDQLKDAEFNPSFAMHNYAINFRDGKVEKGSDAVKLVDGWAGMVNQTAQYAELMAALSVFEMPAKAKHYFILSDSQYFVNGFNKDADNWAAKDWKVADGSDRPNKELWLRILAIREKFGDKLKVGKIKAHAGFLGNENADRNATYGLIRSINTKQDTPAKWISTFIKDESYWDSEKPIPSILRSKWYYRFTGTDIATHEINGMQYHHYFVGDHSKSKDDIELLGKKMPDAGFGLVWMHNHNDVIERIVRYHEQHMWEHANVMYQSQVVNMLNLTNVMMPKVLWEVEYAGTDSMWLKSHRNDLMSRNLDLISKILRPPRLSYRILEEEALLQNVLYSYLNLEGHTTDSDALPFKLTITDVTDKFYETALKKDGSAGATKMTSFYDQVAKAVTVEIPNSITSKPTKVILTRGTDIPTRNMMAGLCDDKPKVKLVSWPFSKQAFRYAMIIETIDAYSVWCGNYSNYRWLTEHDL